MFGPSGKNDPGICGGVGGTFGVQDDNERGLPEERNEIMDCNSLHGGPGMNSQLEQRLHVMDGQDHHYSLYSPNFNNYSLGHGTNGLYATPATASSISTAPQHAPMTSPADDHTYQQGGDNQTGLTTYTATSFPPSMYQADLQQRLGQPFTPNGETTYAFEHRPVANVKSSIICTEGFTTAGTPMSVDHATQEHGELVTQAYAADREPAGDPRASAKESEGRYRDSLSSGYTSLENAVNGTATAFNPTEAVARKSRPKLLRVASNQIVDLKTTVRRQHHEILELKRRLADHEQRLPSTSG